MGITRIMDFRVNALRCTYTVYSLCDTPPGHQREASCMIKETQENVLVMLFVCCWWHNASLLRWPVTIKVNVWAPLARGGMRVDGTPKPPTHIYHQHYRIQVVWRYLEPEAAITGTCRPPCWFIRHSIESSWRVAFWKNVSEWYK